MKLIEYKYSNKAWGFNQEELYRIDVDKREYRHFDHRACDDVIPLPEDLVTTICSIFEPYVTEFPTDELAWDAPMWAFTIDDKTCTRIALADEDPLYSKISKVFAAFKKITSDKTSNINN